MLPPAVVHGLHFRFHSSSPGYLRSTTIPLSLGVQLIATLVMGLAYLRRRAQSSSIILLLFHCFHSCIVLSGFSPSDRTEEIENRVALPGRSLLRQSRATQPKVHTGCSSVSLIHRTLIWTTGSSTCAQVLMHAIAHGGVRTHVRESALEIDSGRKITRRTGESNLRQLCAGPMLYQLNHVPTWHHANRSWFKMVPCQKIPWIFLKPVVGRDDSLVRSCSVIRQPPIRGEGSTISSCGTT